MYVEVLVSKFARFCWQAYQQNTVVAQYSSHGAAVCIVHMPYGLATGVAELHRSECLPGAHHALRKQSAPLRDGRQQLSSRAIGMTNNRGKIASNAQDCFGDAQFVSKCGSTSQHNINQGQVRGKLLQACTTASSNLLALSNEDSTYTISQNLMNIGNWQR